MSEDELESEPPRHGRMPRRGVVRPIIAIVASSIAVLLVSGAAVAAYLVADLYGDVKEQPPVELESETVLEGIPDIGAMEGGLTFLLVGSDKRPEDGAFGDPEEESAVLNDVNMVLHIAQDHSHVEVVSFPRDMLVRVPECTDPDDPDGDPFSARSSVKINTLLSSGGAACVAKTIEQLTGLTIPLAGVVEFRGVAALAEAVGGVDVCIAEPIEDEYTGTFLDAGTHTLTGLPALQFLRSRHGVGDGSDLGRISNQQTFLASLMRTLQHGGVLNDPVKLYSIAKAVIGNMQLSTYLQNPTTLISIARTLQDVDLSKVAFIQYPTEYTDDFSAVVPSDSAAALNAALLADAPVVLDPTATSNASFGTQAGETPAAPVEPPGETVDGDGVAPPAEGDGVAPPAEAGQALPSDVTGQRADEVRCSTANDG
ncbi:LytR family transcriptional regulator [Agromyces protaetiae]|uniref:LytR family transcriptional regulator n=1 Tax=Agromyces protaetiae TaxID=2509455 RepID=A0A4P6F8D1_9MICO|nr:LCP family protein [Agromyces protaetiae]QAY72360.1 LytR family transcriptional regulator [Agromyces protaetiae]